MTQNRIGDFDIGNKLDSKGKLIITNFLGDNYGFMTKKEVKRLRDHLNKILNVDESDDCTYYNTM